jgi:hypothetical protein
MHGSSKCRSCCDVFFDVKYDHSFGAGLILMADAIISKENNLTKRGLSKNEIRIAKSDIK